MVEGRPLGMQDQRMRPHMLGIDDGPFNFHNGGNTPIVGVMTEGADVVEAVAVTRFPIDGDEVTSFLATWITSLRLHPGLQAIVLGGITACMNLSNCSYSFNSRFSQPDPMRPKSAKPPRRCAKQARSQETLRIVLEAAAQVLRREGYARATTNRIAEVAGVSVGTIYQYFANKDVLFDALIQRYFDDVLEQVRGLPLDLSRPFVVTLRAVISTGIRAQRHGPELLRALEYVPNAIFRRRLREGKQQLIAFVGTLLEAYRSELRAIDLTQAATLIVNAAEGIGYNASAETFEEQLADELTTLFARYLLDGSQLDRESSVDTSPPTRSSKRGTQR